MANATSAAAWGQVTTSPERGRAGDWGEWTVRYTVGSRSIARGGALRVQLPKRWHQWDRNSARRLQTADPGLPFYISARCSRPDVTVRCLVQNESPDEYAKGRHLGLDGRSSRYAWVVQVDLPAQSLAEGDWLEVVYGDQRHGGRGFTPPLHVGSPERVRVAVDFEGGGDYELLAEDVLPWLHADPGDPVELVVTIPSTLVLGERADVGLVALDRLLNGVPLPHLPIQLAVHEGGAELEHPTVHLGGAATLGATRAAFVPTRAGTLRLRATSAGGQLHGISNPATVTATAPPKRIFWAELHSHSHFSADATGAGDDHFRYARHVAAVDVYGNADHGQYLNEADWQEIQRLNAEHHVPGRFVTLVGYEASHSSPVGHHNVFFRSDGGPLLHELNSTLEDVWRSSVPGEVMTIPHGAGGVGGSESALPAGWSESGAPFRLAREVYSDVYNFDKPLELGATDLTLLESSLPRGTVGSGWMSGERTGTIAASDNHSSQPGKAGLGLTAVLAPELTREAIFDAIAARRTYATTGSRILLDFRVAGELMGGELEHPPETPLRVEANVVGTNTLHLVEVLRGDLATETWAVVYGERFHLTQGPNEHAIDWTDPDPVAEALYYLRVRQHDVVHGRPVMAWSSPVWVTRASVVPPSG